MIANVYKVPKPGRIACGQNDSRCIFSFSIPALYSSAHSLLGEPSGNFVFLADFANRVRKGGIVSDMLALWGDVSRPRCVILLFIPSCKDNG